MRLFLFGLMAALPLAACAPSSPATSSSRAPDSPPGAKIQDTGYRDAKPDTDPAEPRRTRDSRSDSNRPVAPIFE